MSLLRLLPFPLDSEELKKLLHQVVNKLVLVEPKSKIFLFGSIASGQQNAESDIDLAVIIPDSLKVKQYLQSLKVHRPLCNWPLDLIIFNEKSYKAKALVGGVCFEVANKGLELYPVWSFE